ncbi:Tryptophan--tRNA ligase [Mycoplasmopsis agalactiae]|uniref:Tryptophan--tRNA ligase n=1 Tax=Mycoplasmopsis agalactiae (strain NCTC 10123 / CIP 59.7 / PG2) TaxID=347257 RepID=A5IYD2_MYCAP|nr:tryptophan--tRNA ligase [Mycoplasmopsis agalactiae]MCE6057106.1 tryptophan--tRNA ligase [Mycoplasmopsis agalactiae]MCE6078893.1 tryptophan--tRNA ligase [Mycoplasmopsis agalactiae]MCE6095278.1 tryptophan--tRNA ligase [Mycoplasmopsis agalactiae]MCE6114533.1 tryptophan--tRNA ligase [Mycoplasmopsis agalactiae]NLS34369.1 tryptophan--tRNA ligase [Mycoplasmopsis agalactiae]
MIKRLISGIKPTGDLTLGNYIGAIKNFVKLQDEYEAYYFVADLHSLTMGDNNAVELEKRRKEIVVTYLACGLDPNKCTIFYQSDIYEHTLVQWLLTCETTMGELSRMTQYKDKSQSALKQANGTEKIPVGIFMYPTLMASDILIYDADFVPIGDDQVQHLELTKMLAERINKKYQLDLKIPNGIIPKEGARIKSLSDPTAKMSKSEKTLKGTIYLNDDPEVAYKKIMKSVTDSENKVYISNDKPGILNLLNIYAALTNISLLEAEAKFKDSNYAEFKTAVATVVKNELIKIQEKYEEAYKIVDSVTKTGAQKAKEICAPIAKKILSKFGFK